MSETEQLKAKLAALVGTAAARNNKIAELYALAKEKAETMVRELEESAPYEMDELSRGSEVRDLLNAAEDIAGHSIEISDHLEDILNTHNRDQIDEEEAEYNTAREEIRMIMEDFRETLQQEAREEEEREAEEAARAEEARQRELEAAQCERQERVAREEQEREDAILSKLGELEEAAWEITPSRWGLGGISYAFERTLTRLVSEGKIFSHQKTTRHVMRYAFMPFVEP
jgi:hypothetical protein